MARYSASDKALAGKVAGIAAAGLIAGLTANMGRKLLVQAPSMLRHDWLEAFKAEHKAVLKLFDTMEATTDKQKTKRGMLLVKIKHALSKHAFEEENVIYPAMRDHGMEEEAAAFVADHGDVKHFLFELDSMEKSSAEFLPTVQRFRASLEAHMREEEDTVFPAFEAKLAKKENRRLSSCVNKEGLMVA